MAPLCKGSSREAGEGLTLKRRKALVFRRFSVPLAPSVTLARDTFLPERQRLKNCGENPRKVCISGFEARILCIIFVDRISDESRAESSASRETLLADGYSPCKNAVRE